MKFIHRVAAAAFVLSCLPAGAIASPSRETFTIRVSHAGLDLGTESGRHRFDARVRRAARSVCGATGSSLVLQRHVRLCMAELSTDAARQVAMRNDRNGIRVASIAR